MYVKKSKALRTIAATRDAEIFSAYRRIIYSAVQNAYRYFYIVLVYVYVYYFFLNYRRLLNFMI